MREKSDDEDDNEGEVEDDDAEILSSEIRIAFWSSLLKSVKLQNSIRMLVFTKDDDWSVADDDEMIISILAIGYWILEIVMDEQSLILVTLMKNLNVVAFGAMVVDAAERDEGLIERDCCCWESPQE